jgi:hypothetical protein
VFDPDLRYGEDVDLVWRLHEAGWRIRYDPSIAVEHHEPDSWPQLLTRRFRYGTSAGPLALRHPTCMPPFVVHPWSVVIIAGLLARRPAVAGAAFAMSVSSLTRTLRRAGVRPDGAVRGAATAAHQTWLGLGRVLTQFAAPALLAVIAVRGRSSGAKLAGRRAAAASLLLGPPLTTWAARRPALDPVRFTVAHIADDIAYGLGVWTGSLRSCTTVPLRPVISGRMLRVDTSVGRRTHRPTR